ncbi:hypothetical protein Cni_G22048 [Canna indica]|uniref:Uncharacterized protein n=1 Tax=Canna indica TaxID=4628 RepID=A0AAQ3KRT2_9LILI|nr:hypothetical protein Cni_G22048 [Canna indica]
MQGCKYNPTDMGMNFRFKLGMQFASTGEFKDVIKKYTGLHGFGLKYKKNDKLRWAKSHFSLWSKCDILMNNILESFNGRLLAVRELPIFGLLNWIREYLMRRFVKIKIFCGRCKGKNKICPKPRKRLEKYVLESAKWRASWAEASKYDVRNFDNIHFTVDLASREYSCMLWASQLATEASQPAASQPGTSQSGDSIVATSQPIFTNRDPLPPPTRLYFSKPPQPP